MRPSRVRIQVAVLIFLLLPATAGVLAIHASAACERFVKTYVTRPVRNRLSKQTADAWAAWRAAHPNWKPNPNSHRPKYVMTREESVKKVDFACAVDTDPTNLDLALEPVEAEPPSIHMLPVMTTELKLPDATPPMVTELAELTPILPIVAPLIVNVPGPVPEPNSFVLALSGAMFVGLLIGMRALLPQM
ncbi:MAG TPA: hypothetical protein VHU44_15065 [Acidobacteriaceae bacterium]|jgi:hypothetical protein|nr:hypothetical protein [Acidobacteriaceae bacterium]